MTLKDTLTKAIARDRTAEEDAAMERVRNAQKRSDEIDAKGARLLKDLADTEEAMGRADLAGDDAKARLLADKINDLEQQRIINLAGRKAVADELQQAKVALHCLGVAGQVKTARRNTKAILDNAALMVGHIEGFAETFKRHFELRDKNRLSLPVPVSGGMMLTDREFLEALAIELWRSAPTNPLGKNEHPPLPGAATGTLLGRPSDQKPLLEVIEEAMAFIVRKVEQGPLPSAEAPATGQSDALTNAEPSVTATATVDASVVLASINPQKLTI